LKSNIYCNPDPHSNYDLNPKGGEPLSGFEIEEFMKDVEVIADRKNSSVSCQALIQYTFGDSPLEDLVLATEASGKYSHFSGDSSKTKSERKSRRMSGRLPAGMFGTGSEKTSEKTLSEKKSMKK
jgi:hypothetical protein